MNGLLKMKLNEEWAKLITYGYIDIPVDPRSIILDLDAELGNRHFFAYECEIGDRKGELKTTLIIKVSGNYENIAYKELYSVEIIRYYFNQAGLPFNNKSAMLFAILHEAGHLDEILNYAFQGEAVYKEYKKNYNREEKEYKRRVKNITTQAEMDTIYRQKTSEKYADNWALERLIALARDSRFSITHF